MADGRALGKEATPVPRGVRAARLFGYRLAGAVLVIAVAYGLDAWMGAAGKSPYWAEVLVSVLSIGGVSWLTWSWWSLRESLRLSAAEYAGLDDASGLHT